MTNPLEAPKPCQPVRRCPVPEGPHCFDTLQFDRGKVVCETAGANNSCEVNAVATPCTRAPTNKPLKTGQEEDMGATVATTE